MIYLTEDNILRFHNDIISIYGGASGIINENLIGSLIYSTSYYTKIIDIATSYFYKLIKDHIFRDGNKRTACVALVVFLKLNNKNLTMTNDELYDITIQVAENKISENLLKLKLLNKIV